MWRVLNHAPVRWQRGSGACHTRGASRVWAPTRALYSAHVSQPHSTMSTSWGTQHQHDLPHLRSIVTCTLTQCWFNVGPASQTHWLVQCLKLPAWKVGDRRVTVFGMDKKLLYFCTFTAAKLLYYFSGTIYSLKIYTTDTEYMVWLRNQPSACRTKSNSSNCSLFNWAVTAVYIRTVTYQRC